MLRAYQEEVEARPDAFVRYKYRTGLLDECRAAIAHYLEVPTDTCVFTPNTSTGIDTILHNLVYSEGDVVICFNTIYVSYAYTLDYLSKTTPMRVESINFTYPVSDDILCHLFEKTIVSIKNNGQTPKLAIFDTISSLPGVRMPFQRLVKICRDHGVLSLLDGAHGVGQIQLDLTNVDPDFFLSNCHKWLYVPRGCAVFYVPKRNQSLSKVTLPTGYHYGDGFVANFASVGTLDDTPYLCVPAAIAWRKRITWKGKQGDAAIMDYMANLAHDGGSAVARILETEVLENKEGTLGNTACTNVRLPLSLDDLAENDMATVHKIGDWIMRTINLEHDIALNIFPYVGALWTRLHAQIYLTLADFEAAGMMLHVVCERAQKGEWKTASARATYDKSNGHT